METRPLSKTKHWRLVRVVTRAPALPGAVTGLGSATAPPGTVELP